MNQKIILRHVWYCRAYHSEPLVEFLGLDGGPDWYERWTLAHLDASPVAAKGVG